MTTDTYYGISIISALFALILFAIWLNLKPKP